MPCHDHQGADDSRNSARLRHELADMLCRVMKLADRYVPADAIPLDIHKWWVEHKVADAKRNQGR